MKKLLTIGIATVTYLHGFGQIDYDTVFTHTSCLSALNICETEIYTIPFASENECENYLDPQFFRFTMSDSGLFSFNTYGHTGVYMLFGPLSSTRVSACEQIYLQQASYTGGTLSGAINMGLTEGNYVLVVKPTNCIYSGGQWNQQIFIASEFFNCEDDTPANCKDCIGSFSPDPGKYIISAWVKGEYANRNASYENPGISVSFVGAADSSYFTPSGKVIDEWQRIDGEVTVPPGATDIKIGLYCADGTCYFDDIRFVPFKGSMVSYVYDPITLKLVAQLDERNYSTLYEYDEEGKLIRTKKETERGIMTIQENRDNIHKR